MATVKAALAATERPARTSALRRLLLTSGAAHDLPALDGLRALAILLVIWHHIFLTGMLEGVDREPTPLQYVAGLGFSGVSLFFILSGFLLFLPYARALLAGHPWPSARTFYLRRALRILPAYYVALIVLLILRGGGLLALGNLIPLSLVALLFHDMQWNSLLVINQLDIPFWTLAVEWQFYLLLPWLALGLAKLAGPRGGQHFFRRLMLGLGGIIVLGLGIRFAAAGLHYGLGQEHPIDAPGLVGLTMSLLYGVKGKYLEIFALGMLVSVLYVRFVEQGGLAPDRRRRFGWLSVGLAVIGLAGCMLWAAQTHRIPFIGGTAWIFMPPDGWSWQVLGEWALGLCFAFLLLGVLLGASALRQFFTLAPLRFIGMISYSLYIWHLPIITLFITATLIDSTASYIRMIAAALLTVLLISASSFYLIERPFIRLRRAAHAPREVAPAAGAST